jgi:hypothetical protein
MQKIVNAVPDEKGLGVIYLKPRVQEARENNALSAWGNDGSQLKL